MTLRQEILATMQACLSDGDIVEITDIIRNAYGAVSIPEYPEIDKRFQKQGRPYSRRELIDGRLHNLFTEKDYASTEIVSTKNASSHHLEMILHNRIHITISGVPHKRAIPRAAKFRYQNAQVNPRITQLSLFTSNKVPNNVVPFVRPSTKKSNLIYAILTHGPSNQKTPNFINFIVPDSECKSLLITYDVLGEYYRIISTPDIAYSDGFIENIESPASKLSIKKPIQSDENQRDVN